MKKTATLITGATGGLGSSCVKMALSLDTELVIATDLSKPNFEDERILNFEMNVTEEHSIQELKQELEKQNISIKYLINNAGVFDYFPISESNEKLLDKTLKVNLYGPILTISTFINHLAENKGRVIQVSSVSVKLPVLFLPYANSKIALEAFSTSMRQELSILGIKLILIRPGAMDTNLIHDMKKIDNPIENSMLDNEFKTFTGIAKKDVGKMVHPDKVALLIFKAITTNKPKRIYSINKNRKIGIVLLFPLWLRDKLIVGQVKP
jgi:short-subunit dehydrogenase